MPIELPDPTKLKALLKVLRAQGVLQYATVDLTLTLAETLPQTVPSRSLAEEIMGELDEDPALEIERLIDYSSKNPASED